MTMFKLNIVLLHHYCFLFFLSPSRGLMVGLTFRPFFIPNRTSLPLGMLFFLASRRMQEEGLEPPFPFGSWNLNPVRLPISPLLPIYAFVRISSQSALATMGYA